MSAVDKILNVTINAVDALSAARRGDYVTAGAHAAEMLLDLLPPSEAKQVLDRAVFKRVNAEAEVAEQLKFADEE